MKIITKSSATHSPSTKVTQTEAAKKKKRKIRLKASFDIKSSVKKTQMMHVMTLLIFLSLFISTLFWQHHHASHQELSLQAHANYLYTLIEDKHPYQTLENYLENHQLDFFLKDQDTPLFFMKDHSHDFLELNQKNPSMYQRIFKTWTLWNYGEINGVEYLIRYNSPPPWYASLKGLFLLGACLLILLKLIHMKSTDICDRYEKPIEEMTRTVLTNILKNKKDTLEVASFDPALSPLAKAINELIIHIEKTHKRETQFVADASHELRTPISIIKGYAELLGRWGKDDPDILNEAIDAISSESNSMQSLVENLLFIARSDNQTQHYKKTTFNLSELTTETTSSMQKIAPNRDIQMAIDPGVFFFGCPESIKQALRIFIDNGIKYTESHGIIEVSLQMLSKNHGRVIEIRVKDNGIGMNKKDQKRIFDRFYRSDESREKQSQNSQGNGLGLSIAQIIIENHKGKIAVESSPGKGSSFVITLPTLSEASSNSFKVRSTDH